MMKHEQISAEAIERMKAAFGAHDLDAVEQLFSEDGVFVNARGSGPLGDTYAGRAQIRKYFSELFVDVPDLSYEPTEPDWIAGNKAVVQWRRRATTRRGEIQDWLGCDLLTFEGQLLKRKDTYFKIRT